SATAAAGGAADAAVRGAGQHVHGVGADGHRREREPGRDAVDADDPGGVMHQWSQPIAPDVDEVHEFEPPVLTVDVTDNFVVAELLGPDGKVIAQMLEREPIGYRLRGSGG